MTELSYSVQQPEPDILSLSRLLMVLKKKNHFQWHGRLSLIRIYITARTEHTLCYIMYIHVYATARDLVFNVGLTRGEIHFQVQTMSEQYKARTKWAIKYSCSGETPNAHKM